MLENYTNEIKLLQEWYERTKKVVILAESFDDEKKAYLQPLHEQRYCFDHFMRAINYDQSNESEDTVGKSSSDQSDKLDKIIRKAFSSAVGHLQRAYSDSIEWILISVREVYDDTLKEYSSSQIEVAFPEYYSEIRPAIDKITKTVNEYKISKSVEKTTSINILSDEELQELKVISENMLSENLSGQLENYLALLREHESALIEIKMKEEKEKKKDILWNKVLFPIIAAVVGGVLTAIIISH